MYGAMSGGFSPQKSVLGGLGRKGNAGAAAYGQAMAGASGLEMDRQAQDQKLGMSQMQQGFDMDRQKGRQNTEGTTNRMRELTQSEEALNRQQVFDTNINYQYGQLAKQRDMKKRQTALNVFARML